MESNKNFQELYWKEILKLKTAFQVFNQIEQAEINKYIPEMIKHLVDKKIINNKTPTEELTRRK